MASSPTHNKLYELLGVSPSADEATIKRAYKKKALELHPDKNPNGEAGFKRLNKAYQTLSDKKLRSSYDAELARNARSNSMPVPNSSATTGRRPSAAQERDLLEKILRHDKEMHKKKNPAQDFRSWYQQQQQELREQEIRNEQQERARQEAIEQQQAREAAERAMRLERLREIEIRLQEDKKEEALQEELKREREEKRRASEARAKAEERLREQLEREVDEHLQLFEGAESNLNSVKLNMGADAQEIPRDRPPSVFDDMEDCNNDQEVEQRLEARIAAIMEGSSRPQSRSNTTREHDTSPTECDMEVACAIRVVFAHTLLMLRPNCIIIHGGIKRNC